MPRDFFDPPIEQADFVLIDHATAERAIRQIVGCEGCSEDADIPFDWILDRITGSDPSITDYVSLFEKACELDLEGIVAKPKDSSYDTTRNRPAWIKIKNRGYSLEGREDFFN